MQQWSQSKHKMYSGSVQISTYIHFLSGTWEFHYNSKNYSLFVFTQDYKRTQWFWQLINNLGGFSETHQPTMVLRLTNNLYDFLETHQPTMVFMAHQ